MAALVVIIAGASGYVFWLLRDASPPPRQVASLEGDAERGAYLARLAGCVSCHTDTGEGGSFLGGGGPIVTAFGTFYAPNITSDVNFGIGAWTEEQFAAAVLGGRAPDGRRYYPVFPYTSYQAFTDQDIADLWAALQTVTPAQTKTPRHELKFSLVNRRLTNVWQKLTSLQDTLKRRTDHASAAGRGAYLSLGPGQCFQCHASRTLIGATTGAFAAGAPGQGILGPAPSLDAVDLRRRGWTPDLLSAALRTGQGLDGEPFKAPMKHIVATATAFLDDEDRDTLARFLLIAEADPSSTAR